MKTIEKLFGLSVAVVSLSTLFTTVTGLIGLPLPRWAIWVIGVVNLISLPMLIYSTVRDLREKALAARNLAKKAGGKAPGAKAVPQTEEDTPSLPVKVRPKPHPQQLAAKKAAAGNKPKKGKKKKK